MKFLVEYTGETENRLLKYVTEDCSFNSEPSVQEINFDLALNKLNLTVADENKVVQVWGFCGYGEWLKADSNVPQYRKGILKVVDDLEPGFSYGVNNDDWPVYVNEKTGWVCVGNPEKLGQAVEFMSNCVAVVDNSNELLSLWLKPQSLPQI